MDDNVLSVGETAAADLTDDRPVGDTLTQAMEQGFETITEERILDMQQRMPQIIAERRADRAGFEARLYARWRRALDLFEAIMVIAQESGQEFNQKHRAGASQNEDHVFDALSRLHARACLIASEVLALLRSGHASGAHARWRTLHELAVVAYFIEKHGEEVAERYLLHYMVESAKSAEEYQIYSARLNTRLL